MKSIFLTLFAFILCTLARAEIIENNFVYNYLPEENINLEIIERVNLDTFSRLVREEIQSGKIKVFRHNKNPAIKFVYGNIYPGDKILLNKEEVFELIVSRQSYKDKILKIKSMFVSLLKLKKQFIPFVGIHKHDGSKYYGLIERKEIHKLTPVKVNNSISQEKIINHSTSNKLTIIYAFCPKNRKNICEMTIKHHGKWITDKNGNKKTYYALALSKRESFDKNKSLRIMIDGDTPQGIYGIWASMFSSNPNFGCIPRIDIDLNTVPINGYNYNIFAALLDELVPPDSWEDYWINEWPLAYAMGRSLIRIHANPTEDADDVCYYNPPFGNNKYACSSGCLNLGSEMKGFFDTLIKLGIFSDQYANLSCDINDTDIYWDISNACGKTFLIVMDV